MQTHVNLVDLVMSFPMNIFLQNLASIQQRTRPIKFAHLAEKSEKGSISNLSTKADTGELLEAALERLDRFKLGELIVVAVTGSASKRLQLSMRPSIVNAGLEAGLRSELKK